jgi:outer membrane usher protein
VSCWCAGATASRNAAPRYDLHGQDLAQELIRLEAACVAAPRRAEFLPAEAAQSHAPGASQ